MACNKTLQEYQTLYGVSRRTIQRWKQKGFPLDDEAATRALVGAGEEAASESDESVPRPAGTGPLGLKASIQRLQEAERDAHAAWQAAIEYGDEAIAARREKDWLSLSQQLRKLELSTPDIQEANRQAVSLSDLKATLGTLFSNLRVDLETLSRRVAKSCEGKDVHAIRGIIQRESDEIIQSLFNCKYLTEGSEGAGDSGSRYLNLPPGLAPYPRIRRPFFVPDQ